MKSLRPRPDCRLPWLTWARACAWFGLLSSLGCSSPELEQTLAATDQSKFNEALKIHGPVSDWEVSTLVREANGKEANRARNAAQLLAAARSPQAAEALQQLGSLTPEVDLWAMATSSLILREELGHGKLPDSLARADMAKAGLKSSNPNVYQTSFKIAWRLKLPELQAELPQALRSKDSETAALAVEALSASQVKQQLESLKASLQGANSTTFPKIALALIRSGDAKARQAVLEAYGHKDGSTQASFLNEANFNMQPWLYDFMLERSRHHDDFAEQAFSMLVSQVTREVRPCDPRVMRIALVKLKEAARKSKRGDYSRDSEELVTIVSMGSNPSKLRPDFEKLIHGQPAVDFAEKWLKEHP